MNILERTLKKSKVRMTVVHCAWSVACIVAALLLFATGAVYTTYMIVFVAATVNIACWNLYAIKLQKYFELANRHACFYAEAHARNINIQVDTRFLPDPEEAKSRANHPAGKGRP